MRSSQLVLAVVLLKLSSAALSAAQEPAFRFQPGEWQVGSDVTSPDGRTTHSSLSICANSSKDLSERPHPGEQCNAPVVTPRKDGVRVQVTCHGGNGNVTFTTTSDLVQTFAPDGMSFEGKGTSTTTTTISGKAPMQTTMTSSSQGKNVGTCSQSK